MSSDLNGRAKPPNPVKAQNCFWSLDGTWALEYDTKSTSHKRNSRQTGLSQNEQVIYVPRMLLRKRKDK